MRVRLKLITLSFLLSLGISSAAQEGFGVDVGYGFSNAVLMHLKYIKNKSALIIGGTYQFNKATGKLVKEPRNGYGQLVTGTGDYYYSIDAGYERKLSKRFSAGAELSFGSRVDYTNFSDNRFSAGGYHMTDRRHFVSGAGVKLGYDLDDTFGVFAGYNTLRSASIGVQVRFTRQQGD